MKFSTALNRTALCLALSFCGLSRLAWAGEPTAFDLIKKGNDYVGKDARNKVVQIRSERSIGTLIPNIWYVVYYDPDATFKATEVKFGAGEKLEVKRPFRVLEYTHADKILDRSKLKIDSDKAVKIATSQPLLDKLTLKATRLSLDHTDAGPIWTVHIWAAKLEHPNEDVDVGAVHISAEDGKVTRTDLHIERVE